MSRARYPQPTVTKKTVLVVEDEPTLVMGLQDVLEFEGYDVVVAPTGREGVSLANLRKPDVVLLDLMLPDINGYQVCEEIRRRDPFMPIIMLTARSQEADKVRGLDAGADDYVTKPFSIAELTARIRAIVRRASRLPDATPEFIEIGNAKVDVTAQTVERAGTVHRLSYYEIELLRLLHERRATPVARDDILTRVWGLEATPSNRTVDNFIVKLRRKIEDSPEKPEHILTVYGFGYKLV
ncbi:MAG TPA: response regulator transcription factor [Polyangiaceae bacterium]|nr:response regulator transcription factor [Polyangiaceae bacterium]HOE49680.1 response regulator transcription factor [Polyangiaceae bacterium]HPB97347.1 response regulator transcription factor [Polyangiaceae bacterium]HPK94189.1 response regulator transcription factor [Polyangiaceae bacterium]HQB43494.1 response regulator transcription factor [Polyangiaceae bacterium]